MDLREARAVAELARTRHFTRAAERLGIAQPVLSATIRRLEDRLSLVLFERTSRSVRVTSAGEALASAAQRLLDEHARVEALAEGLRGGLRGRLAIATGRSASVALLPRVIARFRRRHPGVEVVLQEDVGASGLALLRDGAVEMALLTADHAEHDRTLRTRVLGEEELTIAMPPGHRLAQRRELAIAELAATEFVSYASGSALRAILTTLCEAAGFAPHIVCETADSSAVRALVHEGIGVALFARAFAELAGPAIAIASLRPRVHRTLIVAKTRDGPQSAAGRAFLNVLAGSGTA